MSRRPLLPSPVSVFLNMQYIYSSLCSVTIWVLVVGFRFLRWVTVIVFALLLCVWRVFPKYVATKARRDFFKSRDLQSSPPPARTVVWTGGAWHGWWDQRLCSMVSVTEKLHGFCTVLEGTFAVSVGSPVHYCNRIVMAPHFIRALALKTACR